VKKPLSQLLHATVVEVIGMNDVIQVLIQNNRVGGTSISDRVQCCCEPRAINAAEAAVSDAGCKPRLAGVSIGLVQM